MSRLIISKRAAGITYIVMHKLVRFLSVLLVMLICAFVFLRLYGVPAPLLEMVVQRVNAAGIPIHIESLSLTFRGWRANGVAYYSRHPDDLAPLFEADEVIFSRTRELDTESSKGWKIDFEAFDIRFTPSVEWGVCMPAESAWRRVDQARLSVALLPDRVEFSDAEMSWLGLDFHVDGVLIKPERAVPGARGSRPEKSGVKKQETVLPVYVSAAAFQRLENRLKQLALEGDAQVDVQFSVDMRNYAASSLAVEVHAEEVMLRGVDFDEVILDAAYTYPELKVDRLMVDRNGQTLDLQASYDLNTKMLDGRVDNSITSKKLLLLAPQAVLDLLIKAQLQLDELPRFSLQAGPASAGGLLNHLSGSFSVRDLTYCGLLIEAARGNISRFDGFLDLTDLHVRVQGQEHRAEAFSSCMQGGTASGRVFWDAKGAAFGVEASGSLDPNLVIDPLAIVPIATNIIDRFFFPTELPQISLRLGSCYTNWSTFYIDVEGVGHDVGFHEALLSTANVGAAYSNGVLRLDPISAMDGVDFLKGDATLDFRDNTAHFDAFGTIHPALIEDAVWPYFDVFGNHIKTSGKTEMKAEGTIDWVTMEKTDFRAEVEAERLDIPLASMDHFRGRVIGGGPVISVTNAVCGLYGGEAGGVFDISLVPGETNLPYSMNVQVSRVDVEQFQKHLDRPQPVRTTGKLTGYLDMRSDLSDHFMVHASGSGSAAIQEGELVDLPVFKGFSNLMRKVMPGFNYFSITSLQCDFTLKPGRITSENAVFMGDLFSATASGTYSYAQGYDANVRVNVFSDKGLSKVIRVITSPISRLFELHLSGMLDAPEWRLRNFTVQQSGSAADSD